MMLLLLGCAPIELATVSGQVAWMRPEWTGDVALHVTAEDEPVGILRVHDLPEDGLFTFIDLPHGEVFLDVNANLGDWNCWNWVGPLTLDEDGLTIELRGYDGCRD